MAESESPNIILYGHAACPMVSSTRAVLAQSHVPYEYVNIREDDAACERVREINNGCESVPTLVFPDGSTLTEPSAGALQAQLRAMGYTVPLTARLVANWSWIVIGIGVLVAVLRAAGVI